MSEKENPTFSLIIPVYNGSKYIENCLNSVLSQTYENFEVIIIDDGSSDNSFSVIKEYSLRDQRLKVFKQINKGSSLTRQDGIKYSCGKYLLFVDIDDYIDNKMLEIIHNKITQDVDLLSFGVSVDYLEDNYSKKQKFADSVNKSEILNQLFVTSNFNYLWNKVYKRTLVANTNLFPTGFNQGEDFIFNCKAYAKAKNVQNIADVLYHYVKRKEESLVSKYTEDYGIILQEKEKSLTLLAELLPSKTMDNYMLKEYEVFTINLFKNGSNMSNEERRKQISEHILNERAKTRVKNSDYPSNRYSAIFKRFYVFHNATLLVFVYSFLTRMKNAAGDHYTKLRKMVN